MIASDFADKPLLDLACPVCSHLRERHKELLDDVLVFATIMFSAPSTERRYRTGNYRVIGCPHVRSVFGPHETQEAAQQAVRERFAEMRRNPYGHTMQEQSRAAGETPGDGEAQPGKADGGTAQESTAEVPPSASGLPGEDAAAVAEAPLCQVGGRIEMRHTPGLDGRCSVCSWEFPPLDL